MCHCLSKSKPYLNLGIKFSPFVRLTRPPFGWPPRCSVSAQRSGLGQLLSGLPLSPVLILPWSGWGRRGAWAGSSHLKGAVLGRLCILSLVEVGNCLLPCGSFHGSLETAGHPQLHLPRRPPLAGHPVALFLPLEVHPTPHTVGHLYWGRTLFKRPWADFPTVGGFLFWSVGSEPAPPACRQGPRGFLRYTWHLDWAS